VENEIQLRALAKMGYEVQTCGGAPFTGLLDIRGITAQNKQWRSTGLPRARLTHCESLKIMRRTMLITLVLTTMTGLGAIKLGALVLQNDTLKSFLSEVSGSSSTESRAARFEFLRLDDRFLQVFDTLGGSAVIKIQRHWEPVYRIGVRRKRSVAIPIQESL
jgi:hypothetical protein